MIICKRPVNLDDHVQEAGPSWISFARKWSLRMTICKRPVLWIIICEWLAPPVDHLHSPFVLVCCLSFDVFCYSSLLLFVIVFVIWCCLLFVFLRRLSLSAVCQLFVIVCCCLSFVCRCLSFVCRCLSFVTCRWVRQLCFLDQPTLARFSYPKVARGIDFRHHCCPWYISRYRLWSIHRRQCWLRSWTTHPSRSCLSVDSEILE